MAAVSKGEELKHFPRGRSITSLIVESVGKYAVDFAVNLSSKLHKGRRQLHKTVEEDIKDHIHLKPCTYKEKATTMPGENKMLSEIENMQEEMTLVKLKNGISSEKVHPLSSNKFPPEQLKVKDFLIPNKKRIMIRSRL